MPTPTTGGTYSQVNFSGTSHVDALLVGTKWGGGAGTGSTVTYSFPNASSAWSTDSNLGYGPTSGAGEPWRADFAGLNATQQAAFAAALKTWSDVANVNFTQAADNASTVGDVRVAFSGAVDDMGYSGWAYYPWAGPAPGDIWLNPYDSFFANPTSGSVGFHVLVHEIGHALGLDHTFDGAYVLPASQDSLKYSVMAYAKHPYATIYASEPMLYDIAAIQYLYGANMTTRTGDTVYSYSATAEELHAIWDAGGTDTLDASNQSLAAVINLNEGAFSSIGVKNNGLPARDNVAIAFGAKIENANGGAGNDAITGNALANALAGNGGNDTLSGGAGNDTLLGGAGSDTALFSGSQGGYSALLQADGSYRVAGADGTDILGGVEWVQFGGSSAVGIDLLLGTSGTGDTGGNTGSITGGGPTGTAQNDTLTGTAGDDSLAGLAGADRLDGGAGNDALDGGSGADSLVGGSGNDVIVVDSTGDRVSDSSGIDTVRASVSYTLPGAIENLTLTGADNLSGTGSRSGNLIVGNSGNNTLSGGRGNDTMAGGGGNDSMNGGAGRDSFDFDLLSDRGLTGDKIGGFTRGGSGDVLDLANLLDTFAGCTGANAFSGGYVDFQPGGGGTLVRVDADGGGDEYVTLVTLSGVSLLETDTANFLL